MEAIQKFYEAAELIDAENRMKFWLMPQQFSKNKALHIRGPQGCQMRKMRCHWPSIHEARTVEQLERNAFYNFF